MQSDKYDYLEANSTGFIILEAIPRFTQESRGIFTQRGIESLSVMMGSVAVVPIYVHRV